MTTQRELTKCSLACEYCRIKKAKCSGTQPCGNCNDHNEPCVFPERRRRVRKRREREQEMENRLAQMEELLRAATGTSTVTVADARSAGNSDSVMGTAGGEWPTTTPRRPSSVAADVIDFMPSPTAPLTEHDLRLMLPSPCPPRPDMPLLFPDHDQQTFEQAPEMARSPCGPSTGNTIEVYPLNVAHMPVSPPNTATTYNGAANVAPEPTSSSHDEYPRKRRACEGDPQGGNSDDMTCASYLSICTFPAVEWVSQKLGMSDFLLSARRLSTAVQNGEHLGRVINPVRAPEPDYEVALEWTKAYFDHCLDSIFEIVDRQAFEKRLHQHFRGGGTSTAGGIGWYAVRNTIYASGCRYVLSQSQSPQAFAQSREQSWKYLENALSVHTDLLYGRTDLDAIQALVLMAFHAEALGTPALEYTLLSNASRLAQSKGLHLKTPAGSQSSEEDDNLKQNLWWTLYAYEKHIAYRSGIPSAIDDDYITCPVPTSKRSGSSIAAEFFRQTIAHAQIASSASRLLNTAKAMKESPETLLSRVQDIDRQLQQWRESLDPLYQIRTPFKIPDLPEGAQISHLLFLHFSYHVLLIAVHGVFCYPWNRPDIHHSRNPEILKQIQISTEAVAEASRQIIFALLQRLEITASLPVWLTFYFPLVGLINLFVCILKDPLAPTAASDLSLLDIVVGHFGYIEFISSSELKFAFPREVASYARNIVSKASQDAAAMSLDQAGQTAILDGQSPSNLALEAPDLVSFDSIMGLEDWCTFLPPMTQSLFVTQEGLSSVGGSEVL